MEQRITKIIGFVFVLAMLISLPLVNTQKAYATSEVPIDEVNFPDAIFRNYVSRNFDKDHNGTLSQTERDAVKIIEVVKGGFGYFDDVDLEKYGISSLKGIEHFPNLTELDCNHNKLSELDVRANTALTRLWCRDNNLTELDIRANTALTNLNCAGNNLIALDIRANTALKSLSCTKNRLKELDLRSNTALKGLDCGWNILSDLDVSQNTALKMLDCDWNTLSDLDVSQNTALVQLSCSDNRLRKLDVSNSTALEWIFCSNNLLKELDVRSNTALTSLDCYGNQLTLLDVRNNTALTKLSCSSNHLRSLDVSKNTALKELSCYKNQLTSLDVSKNTALTELYCRENQLTLLDVRNNTALTKLYCGENPLTVLDLSKNSALTNLYCSYTQLTSLDISKNSELHAVDALANPLTSVKMVDKDYTRENLNSTYIVNVPKGTSEINFPKGFKIENIVGTIPGIAVNGGSLEWDGITEYTNFQYKLCENPEKIVNVSVYIFYNGMDELEEAKKLVEKAEKDKSQEAYLVAKAKVDALRNGYEKFALEQRLSEVKKAIEEARAKDADNPDHQNQVPSTRDYSDYITLTPVLEQSKVKGKDKITLEAFMTIGSKKLVRTVDGNVTNITMDVAAYIESDRTYIPLRYVGEALGYDVTWDNANRTAILKNRDKVVKVAVDNNVFYVNGDKFESDVKPEIKNSRTMIPVGNFARAIGLKDGETIFWNDKTREVRIIQEIKL